MHFSLSSATLESTLKYWFSVHSRIATPENHRPGDVLTIGSPFNEGVIVQVLGVQPRDSPQQAAFSGIAWHYSLTDGGGVTKAQLVWPNSGQFC